MSKKPPSAYQQKVAKHKALVKQHYSTMTNSELARMAGVSESTISQDAQGMKLKKPYGFSSAIARAAKTSCMSWTPPLLEMFELMYPGCSNDVLAEFFGVTRDAICNVAQVNRWFKDKRPGYRRPSTAKTMPATNQPKQLAHKPAREPRAAMTEPDAERCNMKMKGPPPMNAAQLARFQGERFVYTPETLPWSAQIMQGAPWVPPPLTHRSSQGSRP